MPFNRNLTLVQAQAQAVFTNLQLHKKAERIAAHLSEKAKLQPGSNVALVYPPGLDLVAAFFACQYSGKYFRPFI